MNDAQLAIALREAAFLEGDFTLRSGRKSKYYLDKYLFETRPDILRELAKRFAKHITPTMTRIAGPELGAVALAAATSLETGLPFVIVRNAKKADYGTGKLIEGAFEPGDRRREPPVVLVLLIATERVEQRLLGGEPVVEGRARHPRGGGDIRQGQLAGP